MPNFISPAQECEALQPISRGRRLEIMCAGAPADHIEDTWVLEAQIEKPPIEIAIDTEYQDAHTLSIQAATRIGENIIVQVYHSSDVPPPSQSFNVSDYLPNENYGRFCDRIILRPAQIITLDLSPARILLDLFGLCGSRTKERKAGNRIARDEGAEFIQSADAKWDQIHGVWKMPTIKIRLIGHFLCADLARVLGADFAKSLFATDRFGRRPLALAARKLLKISDPRIPYCNPPIEYVDCTVDGFYPVTVETCDTMLPFGPGSLDKHCRTFLGFGKSEAVSTEEKATMMQVFRTRSSDAYGYAVADVVANLLLYEQMQKAHDGIFCAFGCNERIPPFRSTMGARVSDFLVEMLASRCLDSAKLSKRSQVKRLLRKGGSLAIQTGLWASRYGGQTGGTHGGLLFSRSPFRFWHEAPGQLHDLDMSGCYNRIIAQMDMYCGQPVVFEPGDRRVSLKEAVEWLAGHADEDAWVVRVTGNLTAGDNTLVPSTLNARTAENIKDRGTAPTATERQGSKLFSRRVESGIITWATWTLIRALPEAIRAEYENLSAETLIFYPRKLIVDTGADYDRLAASLRHGKSGWQSELDLERFERVDRLQIDDAHVAVRLPIQDFARSFCEERQRAKEEYGKGSGAEHAWKQQANTMYGVLASEHLPTQNFVSANVITATARAGAWVMAMILNAIQTITDGVTYRCDQIPACTFAECLRRCPDYALRRPETGEIPFMAPADVPQDDGEFTHWLQERAKWFFGATDEAFARLISLPVMEHKATGSTGSTAFDALACDGSGNYAKFTLASGKEYQEHEVKMRGYGTDSKKVIIPWLLDTYRSDSLRELCPITEDDVLLKAEPAWQAAVRALRGGCQEVYFPLGLSHRKILAYKAIKVSGFIFRTPAQFKKLSRQIDRFATKTACGLELLCLRRSYAGKEAPSLSRLANEIYQHIQADGQDLSKHFNLTRLSGPLTDLVTRRLAEIADRRRAAQRDLLHRIDADRLSVETRRTGIYLSDETTLVIS